MYGALCDDDGNKGTMHNGTMIKHTVLNKSRLSKVHVGLIRLLRHGPIMAILDTVHVHCTCH